MVLYFYVFFYYSRSESPTVKRSRVDNDDDSDSLTGGVGAPSPGSVRVTQVSTSAQKPTLTALVTNTCWSLKFCNTIWLSFTAVVSLVYHNRKDLSFSIVSEQPDC